MPDSAPPQSSRRFIPRLVEIVLWIPRQLLSTGDEAATVDRLFASRHVADLRLIIAGSLLAAFLVLVIGLPLAALQQSVADWKDSKLHGGASHTNIWTWVRFAITLVATFSTVFAPVLAVVGGIIAWAYQVCSARLGVVDLFACEISTLCRVSAALDSVRLRVEAFAAGPTDQPEASGEAHDTVHPFTSQEDYFPVFSANSHDLQSLEASVVITITEFYTYLKAARDGMRALADATPDAADLAPPPAEGPSGGTWRAGQRNILYMLFLGMESARHAIGYLVEFEPQKAERTIVVLLSELEAYAFLCRQYTDPKDPHRLRITLRETDYRHTVPELRRAVEAARRSETIRPGPTPWDQRPATSRWEPAYRLLDELEARYHAAIAATETSARPN